MHGNPSIAKVERSTKLEMICSRSSSTTVVHIGRLLLYRSRRERVGTETKHIRHGRRHCIDQKHVTPTCMQESKAMVEPILTVSTQA